MAEKLNPSEIDKLRALVGLGDDVKEHVPASAAVPKAPAPMATDARSRSIPPEETHSPAPVMQNSLDTELFVKVDEHAAIGDILGQSKNDMKSIADTISLLAKAEKLKSDAIERMEETLNGIDSQIETIESKLAAPEGLSVPELGGISAIEDSMIDLRSELDSLRGELGKMKK